MNKGIVYLLTNPAIPRMIKINRTGRDVTARLADLYPTGVPLPFECVHTAKVKDQNEIEAALNLAFGPYRINPKREFFNTEPEQAITLLKLIKLNDVAPVIQKEAESVDIEAKASTEKFKKKRRPTLNYFEMGLKEDDCLKSVKNNEICTFLNGRQVTYEREPWYLSNLTKKLLDRTGPMDVSPYRYFNGKNLKDPYNETY